MAFSAEKLTVEDTILDAETHNAPPVRYLSIDDVYSASGSSILMSKKIKARKLPLSVESFFDDQKSKDGGIIDPSGIQRAERVPLAYVYSRRSKRQRIDGPQELSFFDELVAQEKLACQQHVKVEICDDLGEFGGSKEKGSKVEQLSIKKKKNSGGELMKLDVDSSSARSLDRLRLRETRERNVNGRGAFGKAKRKKVDPATPRGDKAMLTKKRWVRLNYVDVDPESFIGLQCKVFWPLDHDWYTGSVLGYDPEINKHHVCYEDEDEEDLILANENIKFFVSPEEMQNLNLRYGVKNGDGEIQGFDEMVALAAGLEDFQDFQPRDIVWAKLAGHAVWPGVIVDDSKIANLGAANKILSGNAVTVHFFGTHDFARIKTKQVISFFQGLLSSFHLKCKKQLFIKGLEEAKKYLSEQTLPEEMRELQNQTSNDECRSASDEDRESGASAEDFNVTGISYPYSIGDLQIISLGRIVKDSRYFQDGKFICPEGYTAIRKFTSISDPTVRASYKMEVLADAKSRDRPFFRVSLDNGEQQFTGSTPSTCWDKIYAKLEDSHGGDGGTRTSKSGSYMFGFSVPEVIKLIKRLSKSNRWPTPSKCKSSLSQDIPVGYRAVHMSWKDLDKCSVCHMDEEYANNLFLQCDKCRMMVHARCYGVVEPVDGDLWLCQLCRVGAPSPPPRCCLCPLTGGAMKPTTDGRWAHLSCAMWIPETCLTDVKRMEPIDGINRIHKDRWKLLCSICRVPYGACIQCSNNNCRVAYHPLCARAAGLCVELEDEDKLHLLSLDDDEENQCIRLFSFCKRHKQPSNDRPGSDAVPIGQVISRCCDYTPPLNPSGCARTEPYSYFGRRGRKEPEALAAASLKRLFVENQPYLVTGYNQHELFGNLSASTKVNISKYSTQDDGSNNISSMLEKYKFMRDTFRKRLAFGKSGIHGFGIFTKQPHRAGDMVIEYTGELVRPPIADRREHFIYNSLVGAGTYMFRIDDERVIDATRAGSIAHLINHSCEPNCYSRVISVNGDEHIIIFAKRDIKRWEELTYDYRFFSIDERLACYCGFPECRGVVNDTEAEEQASKLRVPRSELTDWKGE